MQMDWGPYLRKHHHGPGGGPHGRGHGGGPHMGGPRMGGGFGMHHHHGPRHHHHGHHHHPPHWGPRIWHRGGGCLGCLTPIVLLAAAIVIGLVLFLL